VEEGQRGAFDLVARRGSATTRLPDSKIIEQRSGGALHEMR